MRLRDRRSVLAALVVAVGYAAALLWALHLVIGRPFPALGPALTVLLLINSALLLWRAMMRFAMVARIYGCHEGLWSLPRMLVANAIAMMASWRALVRYARIGRDGPIAWDKTRHTFPETLPAE